MVRMERSSLAARSPIERLTRPFGGGIGLGRAWEGLAERARDGAGGGLRGGVRALRAHRRLRYLLVAVVLGIPVLGGGWLWLRHSSFVRVEHVKISGAEGPQAHQIKAALEASARSMSTMDVHLGTLRSAVARFPQVSELRAVPSFPHSLRIVVGEQPPAAALIVGGVRTAVAADGVVLGTLLLSGTLPVVADNYEPAIGQRLKNPLVRQALAVLGAAPQPLAKLATRAYFTQRGLTVSMRDGLLVYFGDASRPHAKWLSLARVLADPTSAGATYVDVRLPERPAAGLPEGAPPTEGSGASESTVSTLAEGLKPKEPETKAPAEGTSEGSGEGSSETSSESSSGSGGEGGGEASSEGSSEPAGGTSEAEGKH
jgi:cell division protein FtsQ